MELLVLTSLEWTLLTSTGILFLIQLIYYIYLYNRIHRHTHAVQCEEVHFNKEQPPISIIIYAREECANLKENLCSILDQDYPTFEVIVINDGNSDGSEDYLIQLENRYQYLYHSFIPASSRYISRKKLAVMLGIKAAKYEWLVMTHANCRPQSDQWLKIMARNFTSHTQVVLGYSGYERGHGWLHKRVCYDNLFTSMRYLGFALAGHPYMGIGRNMAYRKDVFYKSKGFTEHLNLQRGDDDLFINQIANKENTRVETDEQACVRMNAVQRTKDWREEKIGYTSTAPLYRGIQRWLLGFETTTRLLFHASWICTLVFGIMQQQWLMVGIVILFPLLRYIFQAFIINKTAKDLQEKRRYYFTLPIFDILQPLQSLRWKLYCRFRNKNEFLRK